MSVYKFYFKMLKNVVIKSLKKFFFIWISELNVTSPFETYESWHDNHFVQYKGWEISGAKISLIASKILLNYVQFSNL